MRFVEGEMEKRVGRKDRYNVLKILILADSGSKKTVNHKGSLFLK